MKEFVDLHNNEKKEEQILKMKIVIENWIKKKKQKRIKRILFIFMKL
jgi:hypothetical protein